MAETTAGIRPFRGEDREQVLALAPRLTEGVAPWRDPAAVASAVAGWVASSLDSSGEPGHAVFVAELDGRIAAGPLSTFALTMSDQLPHVTQQRDDGLPGSQLAALVTLARYPGATLRLAGPGEWWRGDSESVRGQPARPAGVPGQFPW